MDSSFDNNSATATCDESKCVSRGRSNGTFTCYGDDGDYYPRMCADGYLPLVVEDEPPLVAAPWVVEGFINGPLLGFDGTTEIPVRYFTCCPPDPALGFEATEYNATRRCSDPIVGGVGDEACEDANARPVRMKPSPGELPFSPTDATIDAFLCCRHSDSQAAATTNFLDQTECVPYDHETSYTPARVLPQSIGSFDPIACEFPGGDFVVPRPLGNGTVDEVLSTRVYQCCRSGTPLPLYVQDTPFLLDVSVPLVMNILGNFAAGLVIYGLSIPLLIQLKRNGTHQRKRRTGGSGGSSSYSTYNLYLVYLAFPDWAWTLSRIIVYGRFLDQKPSLNRMFFQEFLPTFYAVANLWLNATVMYQVMQLLKSSENAQRVDQPSLPRVNTQCGSILFSAILLSVLNLLLQKYVTNSIASLVVTIVMYLLGAGLPIFYGIYAGVSVCRRGYLRALLGSASTAGARAKRTLAIFFFRIVAIFIGIWFPSVVLFQMIGVFWGAGWFAGILVAIQPIATASAILTKADCRKYILDLLTLSYCFRRPRDADGDGKSKHKKHKPTTAITSSEPMSTTLTTTMPNPTTAPPEQPRSTIPPGNPHRAESPSTEECGSEGDEETGQPSRQ